MEDYAITRVLLVDDDEFQHVLVGELLQHAARSSYDLTWAGSFEAGHARLLEGGFDAVLLDYYLDTGTGLQLLDLVPGVVQQAPVIVLTGFVSEEVDESALSHGAFDFLDKKQLTPLLLERSIRYAVRNFKIQRALRDSIERYESLCTGVFEGVLVHDGERIITANPAFLRMTGFSPEEAAGIRLDDFLELTGAWRVPGDFRLEDASQEGRLRRKDGTYRIVDTRESAHVFDGRPAFLLTLRDITEHKRHEEELRKLNIELEARVRQRTEALQRSNMDLERFAQVVAHDMQTPLRTVSEYMHVLRDQEPQDSDQPDSLLRMHFVDRSIHTVHQLQDLVQAVLEYSRLSTGCNRMSRVDLNQVANDVVVELTAGPEGRDSVIITENLPYVMGDAALLASLFRNLIANALRYRRNVAPSIEISAEEHEHEWQFSVTDNGTGFNPEEAEELFVILHRGANATGIPGHGLGLATCKKVAELHGGRIWAVSDPGRGSSFLFTLSKSPAVWSLQNPIVESVYEEASGTG
jgi:PAS domain S-box-containing protein